MTTPMSSHVGPREDQLSYTALPRSVSLARRRTARLLNEWGRAALAGDAALVVSELSSNALLHGCTARRFFRVRLLLTPVVLRIEVTDPNDERLPCPRNPAPDDKYGRGLLLVGSLATRWGVNRLPAGKTVWSELDVR